MHSLDLRSLDVKFQKLAAGETTTVDLGGVIFTNRIDAVPSGEVDIHFSNAVFEHVPDMGEVSRNLRRITSPGGVGYHIVDFVDHRYYDDATLSPFEKYYDGVLHEINGLLPSELEAAFIHDGWRLKKSRLQLVPDHFFENETRSKVARYENAPVAELNQHINGYEFRLAAA
jgi:SAM-dependent methyltransferase